MIDGNKFHAALELIVPQVIHLIAQNTGTEELTVAKKFYGSAVYAALENMKTGMWHYSAETLLSLYMEETEHGSFIWPEEAY